MIFLEAPLTRTSAFDPQPNGEAMSPAGVVAIIVLAIVAYFILRLRQSFRRSVAAFIPRVTYVDETLLDLVRTRQKRAAADYYQKHAFVSAEEAQKTVEYLVRQPEALMLLVRLQEGDHAPLYVDDELIRLLEQGRLNSALLHYIMKTGVDPAEAQIAVHAIAVNPQMQFKRSADKRGG
jgi:hypothetical protein